ncbi:MAG: hypothetical protein RLY20_91 [Verrucomicrobiota bacterium]|jgi:hypothetical protein
MNLSFLIIILLVILISSVLVQEIMIKITSKIKNPEVAR